MKNLILFIIVVFVAVGLDYYYGSPTNCQLAAADIGAIIGGVGSVLGSLFSGLFGADAQDSTNQANLQATRETNAQNYKIWQEQLGWNREYLQNQQNYNSPVSQRLRFEQAGLNPYAMLGQTSNGNIDLQTAPQAPQMQRPDFQPVNYMSGISDAIQRGADTYSALSQAQKMTSETRAIDIDNQFRATKNLLELRDKVRDIIGKRVKTKFDLQNIRKLRNEIKQQEIDLKYADDTARAHSESARENARQAKEQADEAHWTAEYQRQLSQSFPQMNQATLNEISSRISANHASAAASRASAGYSNELSKTEKKNRKIKDLQIIAEGLRNDILRGEKYIQNLGIPAKELEAIKNGQYVQYYKNHPTATWLENQWQHFWNDLVPSLPVKFK